MMTAPKVSWTTHRFSETLGKVRQIQVGGALVTLGFQAGIEALLIGVSRQHAVGKPVRGVLLEQIRLHIRDGKSPECTSQSLERH